MYRNSHTIGYPEIPPMFQQHSRYHPISMRQRNNLTYPIESDVRNYNQIQSHNYLSKNNGNNNTNKSKESIFTPFKTMLRDSNGDIVSVRVYTQTLFNELKNGADTQKKYLERQRLWQQKNRKLLKQKKEIKEKELLQIKQIQNELNKIEQLFITNGFDGFQFQNETTLFSHFIIRTNDIFYVCVFMYSDSTKRLTIVLEEMFEDYQNLSNQNQNLKNSLQFQN